MKVRRLITIDLFQTPPSWLLPREPFFDPFTLGTPWERRAPARHPRHCLSRRRLNMVRAVPSPDEPTRRPLLTDRKNAELELGVPRGPMEAKPCLVDRQAVILTEQPPKVPIHAIHVECLRVEIRGEPRGQLLVVQVGGI